MSLSQVMMSSAVGRSSAPRPPPVSPPPDWHLLPLLPSPSEPEMPPVISQPRAMPSMEPHKLAGAVVHNHRPGLRTPPMLWARASATREVFTSVARHTPHWSVGSRPPPRPYGSWLPAAAAVAVILRRRLFRETCE